MMRARLRSEGGDWIDLGHSGCRQAVIFPPLPANYVPFFAMHPAVITAAAAASRSKEADWLRDSFLL